MNTAEIIPLNAENSVNQVHMRAAHIAADLQYLHAMSLYAPQAMDDLLAYEDDLAESLKSLADLMVDLRRHRYRKGRFMYGWVK